MYHDLDALHCTHPSWKTLEVPLKLQGLVVRNAVNQLSAADTLSNIIAKQTQREFRGIDLAFEDCVGLASALQEAELHW